MVIQHAYCELRTESLSVIDINFKIKLVESTKITFSKLYSSTLIRKNQNPGLKAKIINRSDE
jgi:hypothetical protein